MSKRKIDHYIITRFNLGKYSEVGAKNEEPFCRDRIDLMKRFLFPSVQAQVSKKFKFIVLASENTPEDMLKELQTALPTMEFVFDRRDDRFKEHLTMEGKWHRRFKRIIDLGHWNITSRIDSDDFLLPYYSQLVQTKACESDKKIVIDFPCSINYAHETNQVYFFNDPHVSFYYSTGVASVLEPPGEIETCYVCSHTKLAKYYGNYCLAKGYNWVKRVYDKRGILFSVLEKGSDKKANFFAKDYDEFTKKLKGYDESLIP